MHLGQQYNRDGSSTISMLCNDCGCSPTDIAVSAVSNPASDVRHTCELQFFKGDLAILKNTLQPFLALSVGLPHLSGSI